MKAFEKLAAANVAGKHLCVGLDPDPAHMKLVGEIAPVAYAASIINATLGVAAAYKLNYEFWASYLPENLQMICNFIRQQSDGMKIPVTIILDRKYGDIGNTSQRSAAFAKWLGVDAVTVNPYMGIADVTSEFVKLGIACFVLGRTSNSGATELQSLWVNAPTEDSLSGYVARVVDERVDVPLGLVVGATHVDDLSYMRTRAPHTPFLIPGVGAQGGDLKSVVAEMRNHQAPWTVNVGRGVAEAGRTPSAWLAAAAAAAKEYHDAMHS